MRYALIQYGLEPANPQRPELDGGLHSLWPTLGAVLGAMVDASHDTRTGVVVINDEYGEELLRMRRTGRAWKTDYPAKPWLARFRLNVRMADDRFYGVDDLSMPEVTTRMMEITNGDSRALRFDVVDAVTGQRVLTREKQPDGRWSLVIHTTELATPQA